MATVGHVPKCGIPFSDLILTNYVLVQFLVLTIAVIAGFVCAKTVVDNVRRRCARLTVLVVGAGPVGLTSALIAARSGKVGKLILYEERCRHALVNRPNQVAFDSKRVAFLRRFGVDFDNLEGCWHNGCFFTRVGVYIEYLLSIVEQVGVPLDIRLDTKVSTKSPIVLSVTYILRSLCQVGRFQTRTNKVDTDFLPKWYTCVTLYIQFMKISSI